MFIIEYLSNYPFLRRAMEAAPGMHVFFDSIQASPGGGDEIRYQLWATDGDFARFEKGMDADPTVEDYVRLAEFDEKRLYRVTFGAENVAAAPYNDWFESDGRVLSAHTVDNEWSVRIRFPTREAVLDYKAWHDERGLKFDITEFYTRTESPDDVGTPDLTDEQREALLLAYDRGYFEVPARTDLMALGDELGISDSAVNQRLKRAMSRLVRDSFGRP